MEDKRPKVYVPRVLTTYNDNDMEIMIGYYVSKAYLSFVGKRYNEDGTVICKYEVNFVNGFETKDADFEILDEDGEEFYVETSVNVPRNEVFKDYKSCKQYVDELNQKFAQAVGTTSASKIAKRMELHKKAIEFGAKLEEKYIPFEERREVSFDFKFGGFRQKGDGWDRLNNVRKK